jgi:hypothetical protein
MACSQNRALKIANNNSLSGKEDDYFQKSEILLFRTTNGAPEVCN